MSVVASPPAWRSRTVYLYSQRLRLRKAVILRLFIIPLVSYLFMINIFIVIIVFNM